jgi:hypothetical protein
MCIGEVSFTTTMTSPWHIFSLLQSQVFSRVRKPNTLAQTIIMLNDTMILALYFLVELFFVVLAISLLYWSFAVGLLLVAPLDGVAAQHVAGERESDGLEGPAGLKTKQAQGSLLQETQYPGPESEAEPKDCELRGWRMVGSTPVWS